MQPLRRLHHIFLSFQQKYLDPASLQFRLTVEVALLFIMGLSGIAVWTSWKMQQLLIASHLQTVEYIANRFPRDVELYSEMLPLTTGLQKTINNVTVPGLMIWVKGTDGKVLAQSVGLNVSASKTAALMALVEMPLKPQIYPLNDQFIVLCENLVVVKGSRVGTAYLAQDVTEEQRQLVHAVHSLIAICLFAMTVLMILLGLRIRRSLRPLQDMSQMAGAISANDLSEARLQLSHAPTEVKDLAHTFNTMLSRLSDSWEQQRQFVSNASHELRTPLTIVGGYLQSLLRRSNNLKDYQREALEIATAETERTVRLLQDLLDLARADSGYMHYRLAPVVLNELMIEATEMAEKFSNRWIQINATEEVIAIADRDRLKQVLINLIDNAVKYSDTDQRIELLLERDEGQAVIKVRDYGIGISLADQNRIFERFYRVDEARTRIFNENDTELTGGHGLGLAIVKTLVEGMGGNITVRSKPGEGSEFAITLPEQNVHFIEK